MYENYTLDVSVFDFDDFVLADDFGESSGSSSPDVECDSPDTERSVGRKWKNSLEVGKNVKLSKRKKIKTVIKLPKAVRSTQFAQFMLDDRFKVRRTEGGPELELYNFPRFSRSVALIYFPSAMVSFMNNADLGSLSDLFRSFFHLECTVLMPTGKAGPASNFLEFQKLMNEMHPDQIICVHSTKEVNGEIKADAYFKLTENKALHEAAARISQTRASSGESDRLPFMSAPSRAEHLKAKFNLSPQSTSEFEQLCELLNSGADVELVGRIDMRLQFHHHTKRVLQFKLVVQVTEFRRFDILTQL